MWQPQIADFAQHYRDRLRSTWLAVLPLPTGEYSHTDDLAALPGFSPTNGDAGWPSRRQRGDQLCLGTSAEGCQSGAGRFSAGEGTAGRKIANAGSVYF